MEPQTHGRTAILAVLVAMYGAVTQPAVIQQLPPKIGSVLHAISFLGPLASAAVSSCGAVVAAAAMPPGYPKE